MAEWVMKIGDDEYVLWSTYIDQPVSPIVSRDEALERWDDQEGDRIAWVDKHLCSCRARLGETCVMRNGRPVMVGGGRLAYHFESYADVLAYMCGATGPTRTVEHLRELAERTETE